MSLFTGVRYNCKKCTKSYKYATSLYNHVRYECGKDPGFFCNFCDYRAKRKHCLKDHIRGVHRLDPSDYVWDNLKTKHFML